VANSRPRTKTITMATEAKRPDSGRFRLQVDRQMKAAYSSYEAAEAAGMTIKKAYPFLLVAVYDGVENVSKVLELSKIVEH
jgi:hypothetical protein